MYQQTPRKHKNSTLGLENSTLNQKNYTLTVEHQRTCAQKHLVSLC